MWLSRKLRPSIVVVTALNPRNAGMYSVDLAAEQFLGDIGFDTDLLRGQTRKARQKERFGSQTFRLLQNVPMLLRTSRLMYWGDFTTSPLFGSQEYAKREIDQRGSVNQDAAFDKWSRLFLLRGTDRGKTKVSSIGQNFLSLNEEIDRLETDLRQSIRNCYQQNFDFVVPRDPISAKEFRAVAPGGDIFIEEGLDAAFLLDQSRLFPALENIKKKDTFVFLFGRSGLNSETLVRKVATLTGLEPIDLSGWLNLDPATAHQRYGTLLTKIVSSRFVMTDVYHCSINALSLGIPVLGMGLDSQKQSNTLSDLKKSILFQSLDLSEYYITLSDAGLTDAMDQGLFSETVLLCLDNFNTQAEQIRLRKLLFRENLEKVIREHL